MSTLRAPARSKVDPYITIGHLPPRRPSSGRTRPPAAIHWWLSAVGAWVAWRPCAQRRRRKQPSVSRPWREGGRPSRRRRARQTWTRWAIWHSAGTPWPPAGGAAAGWGRRAASARGALIGRLEARWGWGSR